MSFSEAHLYYDDLAIGQQWESFGRTLTESDIVNFAGISGDFNPIHVDHEFAKSTPFRRPIAHGLLVFSIASGLGVQSPPVRTMAFLRVLEWVFHEPVFIGDTLRIRNRILEVTERGRGRRAEILWHREILNQAGKVVQSGRLVTLVEGRGPNRSSVSRVTVPNEPVPAQPESEVPGSHRQGE